MRFTEQSAISVIAVVLAGASAIGVALNGGGPWALVVLIIVNDLITLILSWRASGFVPGPYRWDPESYSMVRFGGGFLMFRLLGYLAQNLHVVLLGRTTGIAAAGLFTRAQSTANLLLLDIPMSRRARSRWPPCPSTTMHRKPSPASTAAAWP